MILCYFVSMIGNFDHSLANPIWPSSMTFLPSPLHTLTPHSLTQSSFDLFPNILFFCAIGKFSPPHMPHKRTLTPVIHSLPCIHWPHALLPPGSSQEWIPLGIHCKTRGGKNIWRYSSSEYFLNIRNYISSRYSGSRWVSTAKQGEAGRLQWSKNIWRYSISEYFWICGTVLQYTIYKMNKSRAQLIDIYFKIFDPQTSANVFLSEQFYKSIFN